MTPFRGGLTVVGLGAVLAVTSMTSGAVASRLVGSADIRDNSIRAVDIRDETLQLKDPSCRRPAVDQSGRSSRSCQPGRTGWSSGEASAGIDATLPLVGPASIPGNSGIYVFAGPPATVSTTQTHGRVTGVASASWGSAPGLRSSSTSGWAISRCRA